MYLKFFGLQRHPFNMTPDPGALFMTTQHKEALVGLSYAILDRKGFVVLTGDAGTGKTTLLARVLQYLPSERIRTSVILNPTLTASEFLELAMLDFGLTDVPQSKAQRIYRLQQFLVRGHTAGLITALVVDEAHKLSPAVLEEIRLLGNFENSDDKLIQVVLIGQNELADVLNREDLRQLKQRIAVRLKLERLSHADVAQYIDHRWSKAGGAVPTPFHSSVVEHIAAYSRGIPRLINAICDNALLVAFAKGQSLVSADDIHEAAQDLDLLRGFHREAPANPPLAPPEPEMPPPPQDVIRFRTLERYDAAPDLKPPSFWARCAGKLGLA